MKVINPNDQNQNSGTLALDVTGGKMKLVETYSCQLQSAGNKFTAVGKSETETSKEVVAKCRDHTAISFCEPKNVKCVKN